jgi:hypothetical protein
MGRDVKPLWLRVLSPPLILTTAVIGSGIIWRLIRRQPIGEMFSVPYTAMLVSMFLFGILFNWLKERKRGG